MNTRSTLLAAAAAVLVLSLLYLAFGRAPREGLVVYCAHDAVYAQEVLDAFTRKTGVAVSVRYDTEATKSLGLTELIIREAAEPRCDLFWNNQLLGTLDLADRGLLEPYRGTGWQRIPAAWRDPEGRWAAFAARLRVWIINPEAGPPDPDKLERAFEGGDLSRLTIARPMFGTTLSHYAVLWDAWGGEKLKAWHADVRRRGLREARSNGATRDLVANGDCKLGWTDTDDYFGALDAGKPVAMMPVTIPDRDGIPRTIVEPNSAAIVKGTKRLEQARRLADFLLSEEAELLLAKSPSRQVPLGPVDLEALPPEVHRLLPDVARAWPMSGLRQARDEVLAWLREEALR